MDGKKVYTIVINNITETVDAVKSLNEQLNILEGKINSLQNKTVNITTNTTTNTTTNQDSSSRTSALKEEDSLLKQIEQTEQKIAEVRREEYQELLNQKEILKESKKEASSRFAEDNLALKEYDNTMQGVKEHLADLKKAMQTKDMDSDEFKQMAQQANELNTKLKEAEQSYGQFGRNVGNYANGVAEGLQGVVIKVGDTERTFTSAKQAAKELGNELKTMAVNGKQGTQEYKQLQEAVAKLSSSMKDATVSSMGMDKLLDTMQGIVAIASTAKGIGALFGMDDDKIQQSIQKLVALQNVLKGIEEIRQQMNTGEGIGGWIAKGNEAVDKLAASLTGAKTAQQSLNTVTTAGKAASEGLAVAETAQAAATTTATVATKALSIALKAIGIGLVISLVSTLITYWEDIYKWFTDTIPALKNLEKWFGKIQAVASGVGNAIVNYMVQPLATLAKTIQAIISGNFSDIPKIIGEGLQKTFNIVGNFQKGYNKETERQQEVHLQKMNEKQKKANEEFLKDEEAKYGKSHKRTQEYLKKQMALTKKGSDEYKELQRRLWEDERQEREENNRKTLTDSKKYAKEQSEAEKEIYRLRIANMKEGLNKTLAQLEEERRQKIAKIRSDGVMVKELELETNKYYDKKIEDATKEHTEKVEKAYKDMWDAINQMSLENYKKAVELQERYNENERKNVDERNKNDLYFPQQISSYGIQGKNQYSPKTQKDLGIISTQDKNQVIQDYKELIEIQRDYFTAANEYGTAYAKQQEKLKEAERNYLEYEKNVAETIQKLKEEYFKNGEEFTFDSEKEEYESQKTQLEKLLKGEKEKLDLLKESSDKEISIFEETLSEKTDLFQKYQGEFYEKYKDFDEEYLSKIDSGLFIEGYSRDLSQLFNHRLSVVEAYWTERLKVEKEGAERLYFDSVALENEEYKDRLDKLSAHTKSLKDLAKKNQEDGLMSLEDRVKAELDIENEYTSSVESLRKDHEQKLVELERQKNNKLREENAEYYQDTLQELRDFQTAISNLESKQPVYNFLGIVNIKQTNKNNKELLNAYTDLIKKINQKKEQLNDDFSNGIIDENIFKQSIRELDSFAAGVGEKMDKVRHELSLSGQIEQLAEGINQWVQEIGQTIGSILSSLSEIESNEYDDRIKRQEKYIEQYEELLQKQKDATQEYADAVKSIEDELSTARGDRRQQLIDNLNAEMAAQRASLAQEKKIEKEKQKAEDEKKRLEDEQAYRKWEMDKAQAKINALMAVSMAAVNKWPIPAIPMMAMAAAVGAAQYAAVVSAKPKTYGSGGVIQGKSHRQGGVKVLGGQAEVEGGEFITNKVTTANNVDVLEYINSKKRKLDINDFIDFYSSATTKKRILSVSPRTRFEDGGVIPTLRTDIDLSDRMLNAFEDYSNRPVVVSVVDINDRQAAVNNVKVLAGMDV